MVWDSKNNKRVFLLLNSPAKLDKKSNLQQVSLQEVKGKAMKVNVFEELDWM